MSVAQSPDAHARASGEATIVRCSSPPSTTCGASSATPGASTAMAVPLTPMETLAVAVDRRASRIPRRAGRRARPRWQPTTASRAAAPTRSCTCRCTCRSASRWSIDQPRGIRAGRGAAGRRLGSLHEAHHEVMECLGEMIWASQRSGQPPDGAGLPGVRAPARDALDEPLLAADAEPLHGDVVVGAVHRGDRLPRRPRDHLAVQRDRVHLLLPLGAAPP